MLRNWKNCKKGFFILISILLISSVNAEIFVKLVDRELINKIQSADLEKQINSGDTENKQISAFNFLRSNNRDQEYDKEDADDEDMEEEIYAEDEDGNMFLLVANDLVDSNSISNNEEILQSIKNRIKIKKENLDSLENETVENSEEQTETTGYGNDDENAEKNEDDYNITTPGDDDNGGEEEDDIDDDDDKDSEEENNNDQNANKDDVGRGHHKKKKIRRTSIHAMNKPFRKIKRIIRRGIKHPKRTFKRVLKAIILPKSAIGILTSSMISNAVGFGSGGLAGLSAGTIAGGIASGIFRNFGNFGKSAPLSSKENENRGFKAEKVPIAYFMGKDKS